MPMEGDSVSDAPPTNFLFVEPRNTRISAYSRYVDSSTFGGKYAIAGFVYAVQVPPDFRHRCDPLFL